MTERILLLAAAACAACLAGVVGSGCAMQGTAEGQAPAATNYAALSPATRLLTIEAQGPSSPGAAAALGQLLSDPSRVNRAQAAEILATWASTGTSSLVAPALVHADPLVRGIAQAAYMEANEYNLAPLVIEGRVVDVPREILEALAVMRDPGGLVDLSAIIDAEREPLRKYMESTAEDAVLAADILAREGDDGSRRVLINLVRATEDIVLAKAARASVRDSMLLGPTILRFAIRGDAIARRGVMTALVACPDQQLRSMPIKGLTDPDPAVRRNAIRALANLSSEAPVALMADDLAKSTAAASASEAAAYDRDELIRALGFIGKPAAAALREYIQKNAASDDVQVLGLLAFGPSAVVSDIGWISKRLASPNKYVRAAAVTALGRIAHPAAQAALIGQVNDADTFVRACVAKSLGRIGTVYASMELVRMLDDPSDLVSSMAAWGLGTAGYSDAMASLEKTVKTRVSQDPTPSRFGEIYGWPDLAAVEAIGHMHNEAGAAILRERLGSPSWAMRAMAAQALAGSADSSPQTIAALEKMLKDPVNIVKAQALLSLKALGKTYTVDQLKTLSGKTVAW
jgi:HEAT repeat protein